MVDLRMYVSWKFSCILNFITADQHLNDRKNFFTQSSWLLETNSKELSIQSWMTFKPAKFQLWHWYILLEVGVRHSRLSHCLLRRSELESYACDFLVLLLREFVFQRCEELRVYFEDKTFNVFDDLLHLVILVVCCFFHFLVPNTNSLDAFRRENQGCGSDLAWAVLEKRCIEESNLL